MTVKKRATYILLVSFFLLIVDRALKMFVLRDNVRVLIESRLHIRLFENDRIAFSLPVSWGPMLSVLALIIMVFVLVKAHRRLKGFYYVDAMLWFIIFLGAASNMYDRLVHGFVIDYIHLLPASYFNIADVFIGVGIIALMFMKPKVCRV
ncbi:MAG: hypothetical protein CMI52_04725 [Parcubacteria group bacterium]|nr:hypothetical protein [Parcubacteria group bacterium]|tara:strand:- start:1915 stop:2364 length:450 start_codon:yes stop_codon:yes gene_type:complete